MLQPLWKAIWHFPVKLNIHLPSDSSIPLLNNYPLQKERWKHMSIRRFVQNLHNSLNWKQSKRHTSTGRMNKCNEIVFVNEKERITVIGTNTDEFRKHLPEWRKPDTKECILCDLIYVKSENKQNWSVVIENQKRSERLSPEPWQMDGKMAWGNFLDSWEVYLVMRGCKMGVYNCQNSSHLRGMHLTVYKLYLNILPCQQKDCKKIWQNVTLC